MTSQLKKDREASFRTIQVAALLYSILFVGLIGFGYYLLFANTPALGAFLGIVLAALAWSIARFLGNEDQGIKRYAPLFVFLLLISAVGVFNNLMLTFEGKKIFTEAVNNAEDQYDQLATSFSATPEKIKAVEPRVRTVFEALSNLEREITNRANCGQGPAALERINELKQLLPGFRELTRPAGNPCARLDELVQSYRESVNGLIASTPWYIEAEYGAWAIDRQRLLSANSGSIAKAKQSLAEVRSDVNSSTGATLITQAKPRLEAFDTEYRQSLATVTKYVDTKTLPRELDLLSVRSVGEWSQLPNLIFDRLDKATTYLYPALAIFADWLMVYLFALVRARRVRAPPSVGGEGSLQVLRS